jgi:isoprenylcysteine carboxyl methyltransferase (ICMT) family protein YpbQ
MTMTGGQVRKAGAGASVMERLARYRVHLGFLAAIAALVLARPTLASWRSGLVIALVGECVRLWAAGHIEKGREITRSGPYRFVRHPLYLGSTLIGVGFSVAAWSVPVAVLCVVYLGVTLAAAVRTEEATLDARFAGAYSAYREGRATPVTRRFSWARVIANREYRAVTGLIAAFLYLYWRV